MEVVGDGFLVELGQTPFLGADRRREIAEVVGGQGKIGSHALTDRLAVVPALRDRQHLQVVLDPIGDLVQDPRPLGG